MSGQERALIGLMLSSLLLGLTAPAPAAAERGLDEARAHFERALDLEQAGELEEALTELDRANEIRPSFRLHQHMGRVCQGLGLLADAFRHYELFLTEGGDRVEPDLRRQISRALGELRAQLAMVRIVAPDGVSLHVDGVPLGRTPLSGPLVLEPGRHTLDLRLQGSREIRRELTLAGGEEVSLEEAMAPLQRAPDEVDPELTTPLRPPTPAEQAAEQAASSPAPERAGRRRPIPLGWFAGVTATSAVTLVAGAIFGGLALGGQDEFREVNRPDRTATEDELAQELAGRGLSFAVAADVLLPVGAILAAAAVVLAFFTDFASRRSARTDAPRQELSE